MELPWSTVFQRERERERERERMGESAAIESFVNASFSSVMEASWRIVQIQIEYRCSFFFSESTFYLFLIKSKHVCLLS